MGEVIQFNQPKGSMIVDGVDFTRCNTEGAKLKQGKLVNCKGVD